MLLLSKSFSVRVPEVACPVDGGYLSHGFSMSRAPSKGKVPWIGLEILRERLAPSFNRREKTSAKRKKHPHVDFSGCTEEDELFDVTRKAESFDAMNERAWQFWKFVVKRPEKCIAVVSHEGLLSCIVNVVACSKALRKRFRNAEARVAFLSNKAERVVLEWG